MPSNKYRSVNKYGKGKRLRIERLRQIRHRKSTECGIEQSTCQDNATPSTSSGLPVCTTASVEKLTRYGELQSSNSAMSSCSDSNLNASCIIVSMTMLNSLVDGLICGQCNTANLTVNTKDAGAGLVTSLEVFCSICQEVVNSCASSNRIGSNSSRSPFEINRRITTAMMEMGVGYAGLQTFTGVMGMPCLHHKSFIEHTKGVTAASQEIVSSVLADAGKLVRKAYMDLDPSLESTSIINISVSYDGTWMKRGHTSNYGIGVCADLLTGLVLDFEVLSKYCHSCAIIGNKLKEIPTEYDSWYEDHKRVCEKNYNGTSGGMEMVAAERIWKRSLKHHNMRYTTMLSDGDSKTYKYIDELNIYGEQNKIVKEECINHVSKRLGTALRNIRKEKQLGGKGYGRLTDQTIAKLTKYYEKAIRTNTGNVDDMRCAIFASWMHCISTDEAPYHTRCPHGEESWCFYNRALARKEAPGSHKENIGTPLCAEVGEAVKPIYRRLADPALIERCLHGKTQNVNESLHSVIWKKCPKTQFVSKRRVESAACSAISNFNSGYKSMAQTLELMGITPGKITMTACQMKDETRIRKSIQKDSECIKRRRVKQKQAKMLNEAAMEDKEGPSYEAGTF